MNTDGILAFLSVFLRVIRGCVLLALSRIDVMKTVPLQIAATLAVALFVAGCAREGADSVAVPAGDDASVEASPPADEPAVADNPAAADVPIRLASWEEMEQIVAEKRGQVVVLDVWSTWCVPCVREFPELVALHEKYGEQGLACMSLNCNYIGAEDEPPEDSREDVEAFLRQKRATFENVISTTPADELFELLGVAAVPVVRVYDREGNLRKQFVNDDLEYGDEGFTYEEHIAPLVEQLLSESTAD
jgi:thiol-disulfide isomerase/thioredoxin